MKHQLEGSEYSSRRTQCEMVSKVLNKISLRDATMIDLDAVSTLIDEDAYRRARHAITEIERTVQAATALEKDDLVKFGSLMNQSHDSLR